MIEQKGFKEETLPSKLTDKCELVLGAKRAAIYDLDAGNVFSLNETAKSILLGEVEDKSGFSQKLKEMGFLTEGFSISSRIDIETPHVVLEFMWFELTQKCNERCIHCYASAGEFSSQREELSFKRWYQIIEEGTNLGCRSLQFIGGEPLLFRGIFDLSMAAKDLDYSLIEIFTNGTLLDSTKIKKIKDLGLYIAVSLYSCIPEVHDAVTQVPGSFQKTFRALEMLKEAEIPTRIGLVVMRENQESVLETQRFLQEMGFPLIHPDVLRPTGRGGCGELLPTNEVVQTLALMTKPIFYTNKEQFIRNRHWNSCWAGKIAITTYGEVIPCIFAREHIVADTNQGLEIAVNNEKLQSLWKITKDDVEGCQACEYRYACRDCRPLAEDTTIFVEVFQARFWDKDRVRFCR